MEIEYEATFTNINKEDIREKLKRERTKLVKKEFLQKRVVFDLPKGSEIPGTWLRVRDEGDKITMSIKSVNGDKISGQKERQLIVDNFDEACKFLLNIGCIKSSYQENKRELWILDDVEITIDEWPFLEPFVEIEGKSEKEVKGVSKKLSFDYTKAKFCSIDTLYCDKYGIDKNFFNNKIPKIIFEMDNPFK